ncbi:KGGVGR-motif variant AAA ATPase [Streptomyces sp. NPDC056296]|uniref:KGGVGR-motif variant AAA ATPase n=1 Tax=Streptomyces sp. NPDC056296 TaxID=3345775 RepID=UPI0035DA4735
MSAALPVRFDQARERAFEAAREVAGQGFPVVLVRDVLGRFSLVVDDSGKDKGAVRGLVAGWEAVFSDGLGRYRSGQPVLLASDMFSADTLLGSPRAVADQDGPSGPDSVRFIDNTVVGEDWAMVRMPDNGDADGRPHRTALYGFKGGVGRTTAMAILARHLADRGHAVLVVDLDLESPGAGPLLMGRELPPHGLVDHLVEDAVGNADGLEMVARTPYAPPRAADGRYGELWVAPARGSGTPDARYAYVDKLNRVYADTADASFAERLERAVCACEDTMERDSDTGRRPDVVLLDSRAGIHDVAAVAISRLSDLALLFAGNNDQTWMGYQDLFTAWQTTGQAARIRSRLRMVASMVPDSVHHPMETYLADFRRRAFECFDEVLYDTVEPVDVHADDALADAVAAARDDVFAPPLTDDQAPHWAIPILFDPGLVGMDAINAPGWQDRAFVQAAYRDFLAAATPLIEQELCAGRDKEGTRDR